MNKARKCECGCGGDPGVYAKDIPNLGYVAGAARRFVRGHNGKKAAVDYLEEDRGFDTPCWIWQRARGGRDSEYGRTTGRKGKLMNAHRKYYEDRFGPVPSDLMVDHLCRVTLCVNPGHMEVVTNGENVRRGVASRYLREGVSGVRRWRVERGLTQADIAAKLGVTQSGVSAWERGIAPEPADLYERLGSN